MTKSGGLDLAKFATWHSLTRSASGVYLTKSRLFQDYRQKNTPYLAIQFFEDLGDRLLWLPHNFQCKNFFATLRSGPTIK